MKTKKQIKNKISIIEALMLKFENNTAIYEQLKYEVTALKWTLKS